MEQSLPLSLIDSHSASIPQRLPGNDTDVVISCELKHLEPEVTLLFRPLLCIT